MGLIAAKARKHLSADALFGLLEMVLPRSRITAVTVAR